MLVFLILVVVVARNPNLTPKSQTPHHRLAGDRTPEQEKAAKEFVFDGIGIGATFEQVKAKWPDISLNENETDVKLGVYSWTTHKAKVADLVYIQVMDGKVYQLGIVYYQTSKSSVGYDTIEERLKAQFGEPTYCHQSKTETVKPEDMDESCTWEFKEPHRQFFLLSSHSGDPLTYLTIVDLEMEPKIWETKKQQRSKANIGF